MSDEDFEEKVKYFVDFLRPLSWPIVWGRNRDSCMNDKESEYIAKKLKRADELKERFPQMEGESALDYVVRVFYKEHLGIPDGNMHIEKWPDVYVIEFDNPCPILEACSPKRLRLDTTQICSRIFHKPYQLLVSALAPNVVFGRDYARIRPHHHKCIEVLRMVPYKPAAAV